MKKKVLIFDDDADILELCAIVWKRTDLKSSHKVIVKTCFERFWIAGRMLS